MDQQVVVVAAVVVVVVVARMFACRWCGYQTRKDDTSKHTEHASKKKDTSSKDGITTIIAWVGHTQTEMYL